MGKQVYIIHGYGASPANHWFPWLKEKLIADDNQVLVLH
ncbi:alpha/beta hydrolase, partial [Bacillus sp. ISL-53]|nr:alpha/beta hydrolase [Bacillus sp. ISL-53]